MTPTRIPAHSSLPPLSDLRWRRAPAFTSGVPTPYLPLAAPFVPRTGDRLRWLMNATRLVLLADGYPARLREGRVVVHPLDGRYLLEALLAEQAHRPRRRLHSAIARTSLAIIGRAKPLGGALVMEYVDTASSMVSGAPHVSALAQAYYATGLARAAALLGDLKIQRAADRFFDALLVPVEEGGTLYRTGRDTVPALVPMRPRDLVLNGWLSSLTAIRLYGEMRDSAAARQLLRASVRTLLRLLPCYDVPDLHLSRYGLTGPLLMRIGIAGGTVDGVRISRLRIAIPGEGEIGLPSRTGGRWQPRAYPEDAASTIRPSGVESLIPRARGIRLVGILSRAPFPRPNRLRFRLRSPRPLTITVTAHIGRYDPATSATVERSWIPLATTEVARGSTELDFALAYEAIDLFAYPTNFTRGAPGTKTNTYHATHIVRLRELADATGVQELRDWADRWMKYTQRWPEHPRYADGVCWSPEGDL